MAIVLRAPVHLTLRRQPTVLARSVLVVLEMVIWLDFVASLAIMVSALAMLVLAHKEVVR